MTIEKLKEKVLSEEELPKNFLRFYAVGFLLFMVPITRHLFIYITSLSLLLVFAAAFYHHKVWSVRTILVFLFIVVSSFVLEAVGVNTGVIFGSYIYDDALGIKLWNTPLIIGINWVFLVYASQAIISQRTKNIFLRIIGGAGLMVIYDLIVELAAPYMSMWHFSTYYPPLRNFIIWFIASLIFHSLIVLAKVNVDNKPVRALFWSQILFFILIISFSLIFIK